MLENPLGVLFLNNLKDYICDQFIPQSHNCALIVLMEAKNLFHFSVENTKKFFE